MSSSGPNLATKTTITGRGDRRARRGLARQSGPHHRQRNSQDTACGDHLAPGNSRFSSDSDRRPDDHRKSPCALSGGGVIPGEGRSDPAGSTPHGRPGALGASSRHGRARSAGRDPIRLALGVRRLSAGFGQHVSHVGALGGGVGRRAGRPEGRSAGRPLRPGTVVATRDRAGRARSRQAPNNLAALGAK